MEPSDELIEVTALAMYGERAQAEDMDEIRRGIRAAHDAGLIVYRDEYDFAVKAIDDWWVDPDNPPLNAAAIALRNR